jgi:hypothetical protein
MNQSYRIVFPNTPFHLLPPISNYVLLFLKCSERSFSFQQALIIMLFFLLLMLPLLLTSLQLHNTLCFPLIFSFSWFLLLLLCFPMLCSLLLIISEKLSEIPFIYILLQFFDMAEIKVFSTIILSSKESSRMKLL